jgi:beta-glucuronidase
MTLSRREILKLSAMGATSGLASAVAGAQGGPNPLAEPASLITHLEGRSRTCLDGPWAYILDPHDVAGRKPNARRSFWLNTLETQASGLIEYRWDESPVMQIPGDWNSTDETLWYYEGPVYFRRTFNPRNLGGRRSFLVFEAVNYAATIWLDGEEIARHAGGFTPFEVEVTDRLKPGVEAALTVRADSRHNATSIPGLDFDWKNYGGITRSVWLVDVPQTFIRDSFVRLEGGRLRVDVRLDGPEAAAADVRVRMLGSGLDVRTRSGEDGVARVDLAIPEGLALWSPETPVLHAVTISTAQDSVEDHIGLRTLATRGTQVLLNGSPVYFRGICLHEEAFGPQGTRRMSEAEARALLGEARALGCNFVRLAHYPHAEFVSRIADEIGLMVWSEIPVYWEEIAYSNPDTLALARQMMAELVTRDRNRASVVMWSVANETPQTAERTGFLETLIRDVRALDPTRLVTAALNKNVDVGGVREGESRIVVKDPLGASLDVVAINQYEAWYSKRNPGEIANVSFSNGYDKPLMFSEFGADALYGHRGDRTERWTEEYQAWLFDETLKVIDATPGCVGVTPWLLKDFRSPRRWHAEFQNYWNRKGVVSPEGRRKLAWRVLADFYARKA